jgi:hypothetical protein
MKNLVVGYYVPSESFKSIHEHIAVMEDDTQELIAVVGASADKPANLVETKATARLFSAAPDLLRCLEDAAASLSTYLFNEGGSDALRQSRTLIQAYLAIAKAKGK